MFVKNPEYFLTIVKERSISRAADRLYLSQPTSASIWPSWRPTWG